MIYSHLTVTDIVAKLCLLARNLFATISSVFISDFKSGWFSNCLISDMLWRTLRSIDSQGSVRLFLIFDPLKCFSFWSTWVMNTCKHDEHNFWSICVGDTVIEIKLILVKRAVLKQLARYPKMVHFDENPIFRSDPISRFRLITIWILDMVKSGLIFSDDERWISLNIFIKYFNEWKAITSGRVQSPEVIAKIEQPLTYFKVNCFYTPDDYYEEDIIKKERADFFGTMIWSVAWEKFVCPGLSHTVGDGPCIFHGPVWIKKVRWSLINVLLEWPISYGSKRTVSF